MDYYLTYYMSMSMYMHIHMLTPAPPPGWFIGVWGASSTNAQTTARFPALKVTSTVMHKKAKQNLASTARAVADFLKRWLFWKLFWEF